MRGSSLISMSESSLNQENEVEMYALQTRLRIGLLHRLQLLARTKTRSCAHANFDSHDKGLVSMC